jgi:hypothetical protein
MGLHCITSGEVYWPILLTSLMQLILSRQAIEEITGTTVAQIYKRVSPEGPVRQLNKQKGMELSECIGRMKKEIVTLLPEVMCRIRSPRTID